MGKKVKETLGHYLNNEREARHISLEDISKAIRISLPFIKALEEDDLDFFSQKEDIPGYLKLYTHHLELDYDDVLRRYHIQSKRYNSRRVFQQLSLFVDYDSPPVLPATDNKKPRYRRIVGIMVPVTAAIVLTLLLTYIYLSGQVKNVAEKETHAPMNLTQRSPAMGNTAPAPDPMPQEEDDIVSFQQKKLTDVIARGQAKGIELGNGHPEAPAMTAKRPNAKVIGNSDSKRYHLIGMKYYKMIQAYHRVEFDTEEEAIKAGYLKARE